MSRRAQPSRRLERRAEREARRPGGGAAPASPRERRARPTPTKVKSGFFSNLNFTAVAIGAGVIFVIGLLAFAVIQATSGPDTGPTPWQRAQMNSDPRLPGTYVPPHPGPDGVVCEELACTPTMDDREHVGVGVVIPICTAEQLAAGNVGNPVCYTSNPPTSGPHSSSPMPFRILDNPAPKESLVHNMEHGGAVIWYNTDDQSIIDQLRSVANDALDRRRLVVMTRYTEMEPNTVAVTAWTRIDKFSTSEFNRKRVDDFIAEHSRRFNPEGF